MSLGIATDTCLLGAESPWLRITDLGSSTISCELILFFLRNTTELGWQFWKQSQTYPHFYIPPISPLSLTIGEKCTFWGNILEQNVKIRFPRYCYEWFVKYPTNSKAPNLCDH